MRIVRPAAGCPRDDGYCPPGPRNGIAVIEIRGLRFAYGRHVLYEHFDLQVESPAVYGIF
jgi:hypothetical protein